MGDNFLAFPPTSKHSPIQLQTRPAPANGRTQESFSAVERCPQPVIAAMHGACFGAAVDLACACDVRLCSEDANLCIAEVKVGLAADVGTLQRMPKVTTVYYERMRVSNLITRVNN